MNYVYLAIGFYCLIMWIRADYRVKVLEAENRTLRVKDKELDLTII